MVLPPEWSALMWRYLNEPMHSSLPGRQTGKQGRLEIGKKAPTHQKTKTGVNSTKTAKGGELKMPAKIQDRDSSGGSKQESKVPKRG